MTSYLRGVWSYFCGQNPVLRWRCFEMTRGDKREDCAALDCGAALVERGAGVGHCGGV